MVYWKMSISKLIRWLILVTDLVCRKVLKKSKTLTDWTQNTQTSKPIIGLNHVHISAPSVHHPVQAGQLTNGKAELLEAAHQPLHVLSSHCQTLVRQWRM